MPSKYLARKFWTFGIIRNATNVEAMKRLTPFAFLILEGQVGEIVLEVKMDLNEEDGIGGRKTL